jgi:hypothetical protein
MVTDDYLTLSYTRNQGVDDILFAPQVSQDLANWTGVPEGDMVLVSRIENGDGTETLSYRVATSTAGIERLFARLSVHLVAP